MIKERIINLLRYLFELGLIIGSCIIPEIIIPICIGLFIFYLEANNTYMKRKGNRTAKNHDSINECKANIDNIYEILHEQRTKNKSKKT